MLREERPAATSRSGLAELRTEREECLLHKASKDMQTLGTAADGYKASGRATLELNIIELHAAKALPFKASVLELHEISV